MTLPFPPNPDECWEWTGGTNRQGYGQVPAPGSRHVMGAHRLSYRLFNGPIPAGSHIHHLCKNRLCCNPRHLEAVTQGENNRLSSDKRPWSKASFPESRVWIERQRLGLSRNALAVAADVSPWTVLAVERGDHKPHRRTLAALARALNLDPEELTS